jgi:type I restriction enzyme S subunit
MINRNSLNGRWPHVALGEVVEFLDHLRKPVTAKDREPGPYPYYGANGQQDSVADYIFDEPLVLLAEDGGYFGDSERTIAYRVDGKCWVNNHAHVLRPTSRVDVRFLCRHLESYDVTPFISGTTRQKLTKAKAEAIPIALPPLPEQKRIADILDKADAIRRKRQETLSEIESLSVAAYRYRFGHPTAAANPIPLGDCVSIVSGGTPSKCNESYWNGDFPWVSPKDMKVDYIADAEDHVTDLAFQETTLKKLPAESVLIVVRGMILAHTVPVALTDIPVAINQDMKALIPNEEYDPHFICWSLKATHNYILGKVATAAHGTKRLEVEHISSCPIPDVPLSAQREFAAAIKKIRATHDRLATKAPDELFNSLVQRAFKGEL